MSGLLYFFAPREQTDRISDQAALWLTRREAGFSAQEAAEFAVWVEKDPRHAQAVDELETSWKFLKRPRHAGQIEELAQAVEVRLRQKDRARRRRAVVASIALGAAAVVALVLLPIGRKTGANAMTQGVALKPEIRLLEDGSKVELNIGAEVDVAYTPELRRVELVRGEAHFSVAKNPARPFVVRAGNVEVRAVGTAFAVRLEPQQVGVVVTEGRVAVTPSSPTPEAPCELTFLGAGHGVTVPRTTVAESALHPNELSAAEVRAALAWREYRVEFTDLPLAEALKLFNHQNRVQLELDDAALGSIRISGVFWADDPEGFSRLLESSAGLQVSRASQTRIVLHR